MTCTCFIDCTLSLSNLLSLSLFYSLSPYATPPLLALRADAHTRDEAYIADHITAHAVAVSASVGVSIPLWISFHVVVIVVATAH